MTEILEYGYGATLCSANQGEGKIEKCLKQDINKNNFKLFDQTNLMYDRGTEMIDTQQQLDELFCFDCR